MPFIPATDAKWLTDLANRIASDDADRLRAIAAGQTRTDTDARTTPRQIRIRLYKVGVAEPMADSEPHLPPSQPGTWVVAGLPATAFALAQLAAVYHQGATITGLDKATLDRSINGLRPTLSRRGGEATWRVPYDVDGEPWMARIDVQNR